MKLSEYIYRQMHIEKWERDELGRFVKLKKKLEG